MFRSDFANEGRLDGELRLDGAIGRLTGALQSSNAGIMTTPVDTAALPMSPAVAVQAGETWYFQAWHRDQNPGQTSNFSRGLRVTFR